MIKKDVVYVLDTVEPKIENNSSYKDSVDEIFSEADASMSAQWKKFKRPKPKKKRRNRFFLTTVLPTIVMFIAIVAIVSYAAILSLQNSVLPTKDMLLQSVLDARKQVASIDDEGLTVDEYYQKQFLLLLSEEELTELIDTIVSTDSINQIVRGDVDLSDLIPEEKVNGYKQLILEYEAAKQKALEETNANATTNSINNESIVDSNSDDE